MSRFSPFFPLFFYPVLPSNVLILLIFLLKFLYNNSCYPFSLRPSSFSTSTISDHPFPSRSGKNRVKRGDVKVFNNVDKEVSCAALVGLGPEKLGYNEMEAIDEGLEAVRVAAGIGAQGLKQQKVTRIMVEGLGHPEQAAEGCALALWR